MNDPERTPLALQRVDPRYLGEPVDVESSTDRSGRGSGPSEKSRMSWAELVSVLFKHKKKILVLTGGGLIAGALTYLSWPVVYLSDAKLLVAYVLENPTRVSGTDNPGPSNQQGAAILNTEVQILTSLDLARDVAAIIGPETLIGPGSAEVPAAESAAATVVRKGLHAEPTAPDTGVINVVFQHANPDIVQPVLTKLVELYRQKHAEIHQSTGLSNEFLTNEAERLRTLLNETEAELRELRERSGVLSVGETRQLQARQIASIQEEIRRAEADLAERKAALSELARVAPEKVASPGSIEDLPPATVAEYQQVTGLLAMLNRRAQELLTQYTPDSTIVRGVRGLIAENEGRKKSLEREYPALAGLNAEEDDSSAAANEIQANIPEIKALESRIETLKSQLAALQSDVSTMNALEPQITELERRKELQEQYYTYFTTRLQQGRVDATLGAYRISNISVIQQPTQAHRDNGRLVPIVAGLSLAGLAAGLGLAFLLELYFDPSIKRAADVERSIGLPLYLTIPRLAPKEKEKGTAATRTLKLQSQPGHPPTEEAIRSTLEGNHGAPDVMLWSDERGLQSYFNALRNRLYYDFELRDLLDRPKLVAVTSCNDQAGVSTMAAGLAASLSEAGDSNVLLVDMNPGQGTHYRFSEADLKCGVVEVLDPEKRGEAQVSGGLYMASHSAGKDVSHVLPGRFGSLVPRFKSSNFDYVIFDLPPVSQMSTTTQLARHMDTVLMIVEAEKTNRAAARRAGSLLAQPGVHVGVVLNKTRTYAPQNLEQEYLGSA